MKTGRMSREKMERCAICDKKLKPEEIFWCDEMPYCEECYGKAPECGEDEEDD